MGFFDKIGGFKNRYDDDQAEDFLDDDYNEDGDYEDYDDEYEEEDDRSKGSLFSGFAKRNKSQEQDEQPKASVFSRNKVVPMPQSNMEVIMLRPKNLDECREVADCLNDGRAVIINLEGIDGNSAQRVIDFCLGSVYTIAGELKGISNYIFIASPKSIELSGDFKGGIDYSSREQRADRNQQRAAGGYGF